MSNNIAHETGGKARSILYCVFSMGALFSLLISSVAFATKPPNPLEQSVPVELRIIRATLADMESRLSTQMTEMEGRLITKIDEVEASVIDVNGKLDTLQDTANDIYEAVTSVDIEFTEKFCIDGDFGADVHAGFNVEGGGEWPLVLKLKAVLHGRGVLAGSLGVANEVCVEVPLYSVESPFPLFPDTHEIQTLIDLLNPSKPEIVPLLGGIFNNLLPTSDQTFMSFNNLLAAGGYDMYGNSVGPLVPEEFTRLDQLLDPITPKIVDDYVAEFPNMIGEELTKPCTIAGKTPLGSWIDPKEYEWACVAGLGEVAAGAFGVIHTIESVVREICKVDPLCHL